LGDLPIEAAIGLPSLNGIDLSEFWLVSICLSLDSNPAERKESLI
jgi:hypothetical protein